jgi:probable rRNA maturation factor
VLISIDPRFGKHLAPDWIVGIAHVALDAEGVAASQVSIVVTGDDEIRDLNRQFAGEDHATDVLAFALQEGDDFTNPDDITRLGEIVISFEAARRQADDAGHDTDSELAHLLVHGILHLLGYDHAEPDDELAMRAREQAILGEAGLTAH